MKGRGRGRSRLGDGCGGGCCGHGCCCTSRCRRRRRCCSRRSSAFDRTHPPSFVHTRPRSRLPLTPVCRSNMLAFVVAAVAAAAGAVWGVVGFAGCADVVMHWWLLVCHRARSPAFVRIHPPLFTLCLRPPLPALVHSEP